MQVVALFAQRHPNRPARRAMPIRVGQQVAQRDAQHARVAQQDVFARTIDALDAARRKLAVQIRQQRQQVTLRQAQFRAGFAHAVMGQVFVDQRQQAHGRIADIPAARQAFLDGRGQIAAQLLRRCGDDGKRPMPAVHPQVRPGAGSHPAFRRCATPPPAPADGCAGAPCRPPDWPAGAPCRGAGAHSVPR
ncbi:hypothetical protein G6F31_017757 [Rhizopus arrhizus]|nr:hypothetical protein G6F31_017757 [Rhizopus arrhizus]